MKYIIELKNGSIFEIEEADEDGFCNADYLIEEIKNHDKK